MSDALVSPEKTLKAVLERSRRAFTPLRRSFLQSDERSASRLADFVHGRRNTGLDLYLLMLHQASGGEYTTSLAASVWARALDLPGGRTGRSTVNRNLAWLEDLSLIGVERVGHSHVITILREDGSGRAYHHPGRRQDGEARPEGRYLKLPDAFWLARWHSKLDLPAKAALLIALSRSDDFYLLQEKAPEWYGFSADTMGRGLRSLRDKGLLKAREVRKEAPLSPQGFTVQLHYTLQPPFGPRGRVARESK
jgi:hypothetical protein